MDGKRGLPVIGRFIERPEALVAQRNTVDVAEKHCTWKSELRCGSLELGDGCSGIVQRQRCERSESSFLRRDYFCKCVVHQTRQAPGSLAPLYLGAAPTERNHLLVHPLL